MATLATFCHWFDTSFAEACRFLFTDEVVSKQMKLLIMLLKSDLLDCPVK